MNAQKKLTLDDERKKVGTQDSGGRKACELFNRCNVGYQCHTNYGVGDQFTIECTCALYNNMHNVYNPHVHLHHGQTSANRRPQ